MLLQLDLLYMYHYEVLTDELSLLRMMEKYKYNCHRDMAGGTLLNIGYAVQYSAKIIVPGYLMLQNTTCTSTPLGQLQPAI